jgi:hypothetical protein
LCSICGCISHNHNFNVGCLGIHVSDTPIDAGTPAEYRIKDGVEPMSAVCLPRLGSHIGGVPDASGVIDPAT